MIPWSEGRFLVWDATCVDTFCESHRQRATQEKGGAAAHAEKEKARKYAHLDRAYCFMPIAFETSWFYWPRVNVPPKGSGKTTEVLYRGAPIICTYTCCNGSQWQFKWGIQLR